MSSNVKEIVISESPRNKTMMVVKQTIVPKKKNRKGEQFIISETIHKALPNKKKRREG